MKDREPVFRVNSACAIVLSVASTLCYASITADAAEPSRAVESPSQRLERKQYVAPDGFAGHPWGQSYLSFEGLKRSPIALELAASEGKLVKFDCAINCSKWAAISEIGGQGLYLFSEFLIPQQGFRYGRNRTLMYPVTYQFCAKWPALQSGKPSGTEAEKQMELCGVRMVFKSQTPAEMEGMRDDELTTYEAVLRDLIDQYGEPDGFSRRARVIVEAADAPVAERRRRLFRTWRWCPPYDREIAPKCGTGIVLGFNPESGNGVVLYASKLVWEYAWARDLNIHGHDPMFMFLQGRDSSNASLSDAR